MEFERAKLDIDGSVGILTLNHPEVMNAVSTEMIGGIMSALAEAEKPKNGVRCLIMTGAGSRLLRGRESATFRQRERTTRRRLGAGNPLPSDAAQAARIADADRQRGEWRGGGSRHEPRADGRPGDVREVVIFPPGVSAHRPGARRRLDLDSAAPRRSCSRDGTFADGRETAGRESARMGPHLSRRRRCAVDGGSEEAGARPRERSDRRAQPHSENSTGTATRTPTSSSSTSSGRCRARPAGRRISTRACARFWKSGRRNSRASEARPRDTHILL